MELDWLSTSASSPPVQRHLARGCYTVILASGPEDGGKRATLALAAACTAQAMDLDTIVFLAPPRCRRRGDVLNATRRGQGSYPATPVLIDWSNALWSGV